jgi:RHS repeat-associated protein
MKNTFKYIAVSIFLSLVGCIDAVAQCEPGSLSPSPVVYDESNSCNVPDPPVQLRATSTDACSKVITHKWYTSPSGNATVPSTVESVGTCAVYRTVVSVTTTTTYWVSAIVNGCESPRVKVTGSVFKNDIPVLSLTPATGHDANGFFGAVVPTTNGVGQVTLTASGGASGSVYQWYNAPISGVLLATGTSYSPTVTDADAMNGIETFYVGGTLKNRLGCSFPISARKAVAVKLMDYQQWINSVTTYTPLNQFTTTADVIIAPIDAVSVNVEYMDGLGRTDQLVAKQASPTKKDMVIKKYYDGHGRETRAYLPVAVNETAGNYKVGILDPSGNFAGPALNFYSNPTDNIADDTKPFAGRIYESLLNRGFKIGAPGAEWQPTESTKTSYSNYSASWYYTDFVVGPSQGGGSVSANITNNVLTVTFSAGFSATPLKTGYIKTLYTNGIYDMDLGLIANGNYRTYIKGSGIYVESVHATPVAVTGLSSTFTVDLIGHAVKKFYGLNVANEVLDWTYNYSTKLVEAGTASAPVYYPANKLVVVKTYDENNNLVLEYLDESGKTLLKRVQTGTVQTPVNDANFAATYYVYDDFGNIVCVVPPEAVSRLATEYFHSTATATTKNSFLNRWTFQYSYDSRGRLTRKKMPGVKSIYYVYDYRNRVILTQDGNQRKSISGALLKEWLFTKYDKFNRSIITGLYTHTGNDTSQFEMQAYVNTIMTSGNQFFEDYDGSPSTDGYTNRVFPTTNKTHYTVSYYDSHNFMADLLAGSSVYQFVSSDIPDQGAKQNSLKTLPTGSKINILGSSDYLWNVTYYDSKYRTIQTIQQTLHSGNDRKTSKLDFTGRVLKTKSTYNVNNTTTTSEYENVVDHAGRALVAKHSINGNTPIVVAGFYYNELGQLVKKGQHNPNYPPIVGGDYASAAAAALPGFSQVIDYRYHIRGWISRINNSDVGPVADGNAVPDYFGMEFAYNNVLSGLTTEKLFNGNVSAIKWGKGSGGSVAQQAYTFRYDPMNRLKFADHFDKGTSGWVANSNPYSETLTYDLNGNIKTLVRKGFKGAGLDNLTYGYSGNQLTYVSDSHNASEGFIDGNTSADDYSYDSNGNLIKDKNKGLLNNNDIRYNFMSLPREVKKGVEAIRYTYDATGRKLVQEVYDGSTLLKRTDYIGEMLFESTTATPVLSFIQHIEGRAIPNGATFEYQYNINDHLGNNRITYTTKPQIQKQFKANFETAHAENGQNEFLNYSRTAFDLVDHTDATGTVYDEVQWLNGGESGRVGIARSINVMPGDQITIEAFAKYMNVATTTNPTSFALALTTAFGVQASSTGDELRAYNSLNSFAASVPSGDRANDNDALPKAFVTILLFDSKKNLIDATWDQIGSAGAQTSGSVKQPPHDLLSATYRAKEAGYAYIFVSNEHPTYVDVYFDDITVTHSPSPIISTSDYYPFGMTYNSMVREGEREQAFKFNGKEEQSELGIGWLDYGARMYMSDIGRWTTIDPLLEKYTSFTPYNYCIGNPVVFIDPNGMDSRYNWDTGQYYDDTNGNGTQDGSEGNVSFEHVQEEYGFGAGAKESYAAIFANLDPGGNVIGEDGGVNNMLASAQLNQDELIGTYWVIHVKNSADAAQELAGLPVKIKGLIIASHGNLDEAWFAVGSESFSKVTEIQNSQGLAKMAAALPIDTEIIFTACNLGSTMNNGENLLKAAAVKFKRTVYGNRSFTPGWDRLFQGGEELPAYYTGSIPNYPLETSVGPGAERVKYAYANRGVWSKVTYSNGNSTVHKITKPYFDSLGKFRYIQ